MHSQRTVTVATIALAGALAFGCNFVENDDLNQAALAGDRSRCEALLKKGASVNGPGMHGMKPIMSAAKGGSVETTRYLISNGADVNAHNDSGSALMWAVDSGNEELLRLLLVRGADASWTNALGQTALDLAAEERKTNLVAVLQSWSKRAEPNAAPIAAPPHR
jgi:ankyrin repeat protein